MLNISDDSQVGVVGLDEIMRELHARSTKADYDACRQIIERLEEKGNFIPPSEHIRRQYAYALLREYRSYIQNH